MLFAHLKRILKLDRVQLQDLSGAQDEFLPAATMQIEVLRHCLRAISTESADSPFCKQASNPRKMRATRV